MGDRSCIIFGTDVNEQEVWTFQQPYWARRYIRSTIQSAAYFFIHLFYWTSIVQIAGQYIFRLL